MQWKQVGAEWRLYRERRIVGRVVPDDWAAHGAEAIRVMRYERPSDYVRVVASLISRFWGLIRGD
jgi:hypothetical protein